MGLSLIGIDSWLIGGCIVVPQRILSFRVELWLIVLEALNTGLNFEVVLSCRFEEIEEGSQ